MYRITRFMLAPLAVSILLSAGCVNYAGINHQGKLLSLGEASSDSLKDTLPPAAWPRSDWWATLGDPRLGALIALGVLVVWWLPLVLAVVLAEVADGSLDAKGVAHYTDNKFEAGETPVKELKPNGPPSTPPNSSTGSAAMASTPAAKSSGPTSTATWPRSISTRSIPPITRPKPMPSKRQVWPWLASSTTASTWSATAKAAPGIQSWA